MSKSFGIKDTIRSALNEMKKTGNLKKDQRELLKKGTVQEFEVSDQLFAKGGLSLENWIALIQQIGCKIVVVPLFSC